MLSPVLQSVTPGTPVTCFTHAQKQVPSFKPFRFNCSYFIMSVEPSAEHIYTYVLNSSRKSSFLLPCCRKTGSSFSYNTNSAPCTRKYINTLESFSCDLIPMHTVYVLMEASSITSCSATSCAMQGHPMELIWRYGQKAYSLPHKHKPKLFLSQTWQHFKFLLPM